MKVVLVHGFNVKDGGESTIDTLKTFINAYENMEVLEADYGWIGYFGVRFFNDNIATMLSTMTPNGSVGIGHSNGCTLLIEAARRNPRAYEHLILINPALDSDTPIPAGIKTVNVIYTEHDKTVWLSKFRPFHAWGQMGRVGYTGIDRRVRNWNGTVLLTAKEHSDIFQHPVALFEKIIHPILKSLTNAEKYDIIY